MIDTRTGQLLVIDDDPDVCATVAAMLNAAGYEVVSFSEPVSALNEVKARPIDLMVVDFAMPDMRGDQFAAEARLHRDVPVVFITGYAAPNLLLTERWVLRKPFSMASLLQTIERAMRS
jgi:CheY-like chemotaxis protein